MNYRTNLPTTFTAMSDPDASRHDTSNDQVVTGIDTSLLTDGKFIEIAPIETKYKNRFFRSRLEARWAVVLDALGIRWDYEKEGYRIKAATNITYLPDFYLPDHRWFVEVKRSEQIDSELFRLRAFANLIQFEGYKGLLLFIGAPGEMDDTTSIFRNELGVRNEMALNGAFLAGTTAQFEHGQSPDDVVKMAIATLSQCAKERKIKFVICGESVTAEHVDESEDVSRLL